MLLFIKGKKNISTLVPVEKQVTKKGKTFTQTFYVKVDYDEYMAKKNKKVDEPKQDKKKKDKVSKNHEAYNQPDGTYVNVRLEAGGVNMAVRVPDENVHSSFESRGHKFFVCNELQGSSLHDIEMLPDYRVYEMTTGIAVSSPAVTPEEAIADMHHKMDPMAQEKIDRIIEQADKIGRHDKWKTKIEINNNLKKITDYNEATDTLLKDVFGDEGIDKFNAFLALDRTHAEISKWLEDRLFKNKQEFIDMTSDMARRIFVEGDKQVDHMLDDAIRLNLDWDEVVSRYAAVSYIRDAIKSSVFGGHTYPSASEVEKWADEHEDHLEKGPIHYEGHGVSSHSEEVSFDDDEIIGYAFVNNVSLNEAVEAVTEIMLKRQDEIEETTSMKDVSGNEWDGIQLHLLGRWVGGEVKGNRKKARDYFQMKEDGKEWGTWSGDSLIETIVDGHFTEYDFLEDDKLYRGSKNTEWMNCEVGDVIPLGMASFSKASSVGEEYSAGAIFIIDQENLTPETKVIGVDVDSMIEGSEDHGTEQLIHKYNIAAYADEREFLLVAPSLKVVSIDHPTNSRYTHVHVIPNKMELVDMLKSKFSSDEDRIEAIARSFDYPMGREPEDAYDSVSEA